MWFLAAFENRAVSDDEATVVIFPENAIALQTVFSSPVVPPLSWEFEGAGLERSESRQLRNLGFRVKISRCDRNDRE